MTASGRPNRIAAAYTGTALMVFNTLVAVALLELGAAGLLAVRAWVSPAVDVRSLRPYYAEQPWGAQYWSDFARQSTVQDYSPYVGWRPRPFVGDEFTIDESGRRRVPGARCEAGAFRVFAFGGSTMLGTGANDAGTIPALLQAGFTSRRSGPVCVSNFGASAWVSTQSRIELEAQLAAGERPDLAVFYDGANDVFASYQSGRPAVPQNLDQLAALYEGRRGFVARVVAGSSAIDLLRRVLKRLGAFPEPPQLDYRSRGAKADRLAQEISDAYFANVDLVEILAARYGFDAAFFWQPVLVVDPKPRNEWEQSLADAEPDARVRLYERTYERVRAEIPRHPRVVDLSQAFAGVSEEIYIDPVHVNPLGNERVVAGMFGALDAER